MEQEKEEQQNIEDWRDEVSDSSSVTLKVEPDQEVTFVFLNEGEKRTHPDYGTSLVFEVEHEKEKKLWYVNDQNFDLKRQIKALGKLVGLPVKVTRTGAKKSDTRYQIEQIE